MTPVFPFGAIPVDPVSPFQRVLIAFAVWEAETEDPERAESEFRAAMRDFLAPIHNTSTHNVATTTRVLQHQLHSEPTVEITGRLTDDADIAALLVKGWTTLEEPEVKDVEYGCPSAFVTLCRPATPDEAAAAIAARNAEYQRQAEQNAAQREAQERAEYERLKAKFEGGGHV